MEYLTPILLGIPVAIAVFLLFVLRPTTIFEFQRGIKYYFGRFDRVLGPGQHWRCPLFSTIHRLDVRPRVLSVPGQEVLTSDGVALKVSLAARYEIDRPDVAVIGVQDFQAALYLELQTALREIVGAVPIERVLEDRSAFAERLQSMTADKAADLGLKLHSANVKDIMFPGALKQTFAQVVQARKEGEAALERARGETAALRNLANAASVLEKNPVLLQLRWMQSVSGPSGNTLVMGLPPDAFPVPLRDSKPATAADKPAKKTARKRGPGR